MKKIITENKHKDLYPAGSRPGVLYGRAKIHKPIKDNVPSFRLILSAIGTPSYKLSKFFVPLLAPLTLNEYTIKDLFLFAEKLLNYNSNLVMASFDVESLFTNISLQEILTFVQIFCLMIIPTLTILPKQIFMSYLLLLCLSQ